MYIHSVYSIDPSVAFLAARTFWRFYMPMRACCEFARPEGVENQVRDRLAGI